ncbi:carboxyl transferase domain-containing protein, partial [Bacillus safensis]
NTPFDMYQLIDLLIDEGSFFEIKKLFAAELITGFGRMNGQPVGLIANQPRVKGGVLFHDSADKAAKFIQLCDAFHIPLLFLADIPGFMIGTKVEQAGIIRHGAKMISAMSEATVPKISVIVRKAYGAGLYAMAGPAFEPDCCLALPSAQIAVMGPEAAVNAVYANKIAELPAEERAAFIQEKRKEYQEDMNIYELASEMIVDGVIPFDHLRDELCHRLQAYTSKEMTFTRRKHPVYPV